MNFYTVRHRLIGVRWSMLCLARSFAAGPDAQTHSLSVCLEPGLSGSGVPLDVYLRALR